VEDTSFSPPIPTGEGILKFSTLDQATDAIQKVVLDYERHSHAAREIAETYFDSRRVLSHLVEQAMAPRPVEVEVVS
jgi:hypothetical protein